MAAVMRCRSFEHLRGGAGERSEQVRVLLDDLKPQASYKTVEQAAATGVVTAIAPQFAHTGGHHLDDAQEAYAVPDDAKPRRPPTGVMACSRPATTERLWTCRQP
ncbi:hypothetical protein GCM10022380_39600 [Amycolatopsis tucumanensis]|uniref:Uncharacterized protein n=1 Tax=Amycolatopsis tucumanensis TaxID=401106 RepID=A0ABP7IFU7_9PSEU